VRRLSQPRARQRQSRGRGGAWAQLLALAGNAREAAGTVQQRPLPCSQRSLRRRATCTGNAGVFRRRRTARQQFRSRRSAVHGGRKQVNLQTAESAGISGPRR
jgi:hypothetical protein